jgi:GNAT superfamily N-acetyltransferase
MLRVRRAGVNDIEEIVKLRVAFLREVQPDVSVPDDIIYEQTRQYVVDKLPTDEYLVWLAEEDNHIVGISSLVFYHRPPTLLNSSSLYAHILNVYTHTEYRRQGIATTLLKEIIEYAKSTPIKRISLNASEEGRPVYEQLGFQASDDEMILKL